MIDNATNDKLWTFLIDDGDGYQYAQTMRCSADVLQTRLQERIVHFVQKTNSGRAFMRSHPEMHSIHAPNIDASRCSVVCLREAPPPTQTDDAVDNAE